jgi:hypothetical protein
MPDYIATPIDSIRRFVPVYRIIEGSRGLVELVCPLCGEGLIYSGLATVVLFLERRSDITQRVRCTNDECCSNNYGGDGNYDVSSITLRTYGSGAVVEVEYCL